ncbi:MAG TPA: cell division protein FtsL [Chloroflexota bacterium]|nr:cell division protein FtsL [Chloroflexota bacterium]
MIGENVAARPAARAREKRRAFRPIAATRARLGTLLEASVLARMMIVMACIATAGLLYLAQASRVSVLEFNIAYLEQQHLQLSIDNENLVAQLATLQGTNRIDQIATTQLHMINAAGSASVWVHPVIPRFAAAPAAGLGEARAVRASQPLTWMEQAVRAIEASL